MKKLWPLLTLVFLLNGCTGDPQQGPAETTAGSFSLEEYREKVVAAAEVVTYDKEPLLAYDPDREVYISLANVDCDIYPDYWFAKGDALIITKEHYDISEIQIAIPMQTEYSVEIMDLTDWCTVPAYDSEQSSQGLQLYQYMCLQGVNWQEIGQMMAYAESALQLQFQSGSDQDARQAYQKLRVEYLATAEAIFKKHESEYYALSKEDVPTFGAYYVEIRFSEIGKFEETVENVEFNIGRKSYNVDIGQWRFHKTLPQELIDGFNRIGIKQIDLAKTSMVTSPYCGSNTYLPETFTFEAEEDLTITGVHQVGNQLDILGAQMKIDNQAAFFWEMDNPIEVEKGDKVKMDIYLRDERFALHDVVINTCLVMDYQIRERSYGMVVPCVLVHWDTGFWDSYLMAFEGIDVGAYYTCYADDYSWLEEMPKSWLK